MALLFRNKRNSSSVAKERLKLLLAAEKINCSPNMLILLKNDMIQTASKYVVVKEEQVSLTYNQKENVMMASFPIYHNDKNRRNQETNVKVI